MPSKKLIKKDQVFLSEEQISILGNKGTKEAIAKIENYMGFEKDENKRFLAELALDECEMFYYKPNNQKEEDEFMLCVLIDRRETKVVHKLMRKSIVKAMLEKSAMEKKVHAKVLAKNPNKKKDWQDNYIGDFVNCYKNELLVLEDEIAYNDAWIAEAKKMIKSPKYKDGIPLRHLKNFHVEFDDDDFMDDDYDCEDDNCSCHDDNCRDFDVDSTMPF